MGDLPSELLSRFRILAYVFRARAGEILGGEEGQRLLAEAEAALGEACIQRPDRFVAMLAPGFAGRP